VNGFAIAVSTGNFIPVNIIIKIIIIIQCGQILKDDARRRVDHVFSEFAYGRMSISKPINILTSN